MAVHIDIRKIAEDDDKVVYRYSLTDGRSGWFSVRVSDRELLEISLAAGDDTRRLLDRALYKVRKALDQGQRPDVLIWAS